MISNKFTLYYSKNHLISYKKVEKDSIMDTQIRGKQSYYSPQDLNNVMKLLWSQNIMWTRFYIISAVSKLPDLIYVADRLLENPRDFANVFRIYYGEQAAQKIEHLFREHLTLTMKLTNSYIVGKATGNTAVITDLEKQWYENADKLADYLSSINPNWGKQMLLNLFQNQLDMTKDEIQKRVSGQYAADVNLYDFLEYHALMTADILAGGILKQFYS